MSVKGLRKIIYPFAPDQSGAVSVLYELGGMVIICDAGGCAGNVCGFDEPRWLDTKSAVFSAGLRDMDAILGRDDLLIRKIEKAADRLDAAFVAIIGTPVPATIATDYKALRRMGEKHTDLPVLALNTNGIKLYDDGASKAYLELMRRFAAGEDEGIIPESAGVLGVTPLDFDEADAPEKIRAWLIERGITHSALYGAGSSFDGLRDAGRMERNIVVSPSGLKAARYLRDRFGTPYEVCDPLAETALEASVPCDGDTDARLKELFEGRKILIIHQQIRANEIRNLIRSRCSSDVTAATWFMLDEELKEDGDVRIREEEDFIRLMENGGYDVIIADRSFRKAARGYAGTYIDLPHFAVSGGSAG
jgi:hypothetical protein